MSAGVRPVAISSAIASPPAGMALKPHVPQPVVTRKPSTPVAPMIGEKSTEMSQMPAHVRRIRRSRRNGRSRRDLVGVAAQRRERRLARVRRLRVELGADEHLAALGLRDVAGELGAGDDRPEALRVVVGHERVERVGPDRQPDPGHGRGHGVTRPPTADRTTPAAIGPLRGLDADDPIAVADAAR